MSKKHLPISVIALVNIAIFFMPSAHSQVKQKGSDATQFLNPTGLSKPTGYTHVVITGPGKLIYVSGQVALNPNGEVVAKGDLRGQTAQAMENLRTALTAAGATLEDVVKLNYYVVNLKSDQLPIIREVRTKYFSSEQLPASTLVGVTALAREEFMIEIEAVAVARLK